MALPKDKRSIAITVKKDVYEILKKIAEGDRRSISFVANDLIERGLRQQGKL